MIKKIYIENFRCFDKLIVEDLKNFNIIIGKNNIGKTAFLESVFLHLGAHNPDLPFKLDSFRGITTLRLKADSVWSPLFHNLNIKSPIIIRSFDELQRKATSEISLSTNTISKANLKQNPKDYSSAEFTQELDRLKFEYNDVKKNKITSYAIVDATQTDGTGITYDRPKQSNFQKVMFVSTHSPRGMESEAERLSKLQIIERDDIILNALIKLEPRLKGLIIVPISGKSMIYANIIGLDKAIPINYLGEGMIRFLQILLALSEAEDGVAIIDEIERGFHYNFYEKAINAIYEFAVDFNIQIITTTHNQELLAAANKVFVEKYPEELMVIRLDKVNEKIKATNIDTSKLKIAFDQGWEIR